MRTLHLTLSMLLAVPVGCARTSADRAPAEPRETEATSRTTVTTTPGGEARADEATDAGAAREGATAYADSPLTVTGVFVEPTLAAACGLTVSPRAFFEFDSSDLDKGDIAVLRHLATCLSTGPLAGRRVELVGHTDPRGPDEYNQRLGRTRAQAVQDYLVMQGVTTDNIRIRSAGERQASPTDSSEWPRDRRVDLVLVPAP